ncbi:MAG: ferric reductase-like transmembrane domain-containing protein [Candidatus Limnocylindria bacterium]
MQPLAARSSDPLGTIGDWRLRLLFHHAPLALASTVVLVLLLGLPRETGPQMSMGSPGVFPEAVPQRIEEVGQLEHGGQGRFFLARGTTATGWLATGLLGLTLLVGPANLLLRRRTPISTYLARDVGTWAAIFSIVHVIFGLTLHRGPEISGMLSYFVVDGLPLLNSFGLGNWTGLAATVIVVGLLAISSDAALRELKAPRWKDLQRLNYPLFALVLLHAFFYGALLRLTSPFTVLGVLIVLAVVTGQAVGIWLWQRRAPRPGPARHL